MKALTISEFIKLHFDKKVEICVKLGLLFNPPSCEIDATEYLIMWYNNFVSQSFKPELITELFEEVKGLTFEFAMVKPTEDTKVPIVTMRGDDYFPASRRIYTLDSFILFCNDYFIELTWRTK